MDLCARDVMQATVRVASPGMALADLERSFLADGVNGYPVVDEGRLVGMVSRSDVVRQLSVEQTMAEQLSDYYTDLRGASEESRAQESFEEIGARVGKRIESLRVSDVMVHRLVTVAPDDTLRAVARALVDNEIHRAPVTEAGRLLGIVTTIDIVRLVADGRLDGVAGQ